MLFFSNQKNSPYLFIFGRAVKLFLLNYSQNISMCNKVRIEFYSSYAIFSFNADIISALLSRPDETHDANEHTFYTRINIY